MSIGVFPDLVELVNRAPVPLSIRFDGQDLEMKPGVNHVPAIVVRYAKNQHPIMGSHDPNDPSITGGRYLVGVKGSKDECKPLTPDEWADHLARPLRVDEQALFGSQLQEKGAKLVRRGKKKQNVYEARNPVAMDLGSTGGLGAD